MPSHKLKLKITNNNYSPSQMFENLLNIILIGHRHSLVDTFYSKPLKH